MMKKIVLCMTCAMYLTGCVSTNITAYKNPDYSVYKMDHVLVSVPASPLSFRKEFEEKIVEYLQKDGIKAVAYLNVFSPVKEITAKDINKKLSDINIDSMLLFNLKGSSESRNVIGYNTRASSYRSYGGTSYSATSTPLIASNRNTSMDISLYEVETSAIIWKGETYTKASGALYTKDSTTIKDISKTVILVKL